MRTVEEIAMDRAVSNLTHEDEIPTPGGAVERGREPGNKTLHRYLAALVEGGVIAPSEARRYESLLESRRAQMMPGSRR